MAHLAPAIQRTQDDNNYEGAAYGWERIIGALEKVAAGLDHSWVRATPWRSWVL